MVSSVHHRKQNGCYNSHRKPGSGWNYEQVRWETEQKNNSNKQKINRKLKGTTTLPVKLLSFLSHLQNTRRGESTTRGNQCSTFVSDQISRNLQPHKVPLIQRGTEQIKAQLNVLTISSGGSPQTKGDIQKRRKYYYFSFRENKSMTLFEALLCASCPQARHGERWGARREERSSRAS